MWFIYIVRCADNTFYTGITNSLERRITEHNSGTKTGAKYTQFKRPVTLLYHESADSRSAALKREAAIKRLPRSEKEALCHSLH